MRYLEGEEKEKALEYLEYAAEVARDDAACLRSKCGSVVVIDGEIIGLGSNSLPGDKAPYVCRKDSLPCDFKSDKTCCVHAEQRAIIDTLSKKGSCDKYGKANSSVIYFVRLDDKDNIKKSGKPYCTICSKMCLEVGIKDFVMITKEGVVSYPMDEFNEESFKYRE
jgi:deoxycytidylate deaminase